ncbi:hypothetical protein L7F22_059790 [Adiantum nelumboides]|nr:hypothetical protein [Adiantum nelumboides]
MTISFWKGLFENLGTILNFSSAYHPQTDGQSEIANLTVLDLLKAYVTEVDQCSQWEKYLPLVEYVYNNTVHTSIGKAHFEVIEGRPKSPLLLKVHGKIFAADEYSRDLKESFQKIKEAISITQQKQKAAANKHRRALAFKENDWVLLKFPKDRLRHTTGKNPMGHQKYYAKLAKRYYGPFQILKPINEMAYQLKLPKHWLIHNAFHVSLLKPYKGYPPKEVITEDPPEEVLQPESMLRHEDKVLRSGFKVPNVKPLPPPPPKVLSNAYTLFFDGAFERARGKARGGLVLVNPEGEVIRKEQVTLDGSTSNNEVEYDVLICGLKICLAQKIQRLMVKGDALLIVQQILGIWECKNERLRTKVTSILKIFSQVEEVQLYHIPKKDNEDADLLAQQAVSNQDKSHVVIAAITLRDPQYAGMKSLKPVVNYILEGEFLRNSQQGKEESS